MLEQVINTISLWAIPFLLFFILTYGALRGVKVYESFVKGAEEGFNIAIRIIPYLVAMLVAVSIFRRSGVMDAMASLLSPFFSLFNIPPEVLPLAIMRPFSGGGSLGIAAELIKTHGPDSFIGRLASTMQGSTDTTFFVLAVYFGSVGIKKYRHSVAVGLMADLTTFFASVYIVNKVFLH
jgi:spore maturation protein B